MTTTLPHVPGVLQTRDTPPLTPEPTRTRPVREPANLRHLGRHRSTDDYRRTRRLRPRPPRHLISAPFATTVSASRSHSRSISDDDKWASSKQDWIIAARLLAGAFAVFYAHPSEGRALAERCVEHLPEDQHDLAMRLVCNQVIPCFQLWEFAHARALVRTLHESSEPLHQLYGYGLRGLMLLFVDGEKALQLLDKAQEIERSLPPGADTTQAAAVREIIAGSVRHWRQEPRLALQHALTATRLHDELGFESEMSAQAVVTTAICSLVLGDPHAALEAADRYAAASSGFGTGDEIRTLAWAALGDLDQARSAAQAHAHVAVTGRLISQAADSLLLLAVLSNAEGDAATARELILHMGVCRHAPLIAHSLHVAEQLGVRAEFQAAQPSGRSGWADEAAIKRNAKRDIETLRQEMTRRGWN